MIEIVSKNADYIIINKPAGMPSQSDPGGDLDAMSATSSLLSDMGEREELFLIHRLDRVVGGLLVFARNKKTAAYLSTLVADRKIEKIYLAVVDGVAEGGVMKDYIYKDASIGKAFVTERARSGVKSAELEYETLATREIEGRSLSLVKIRLKTGRFHQIRAQFSSRKMLITSVCVLGFHSCPSKCSINNPISGIIFSGVLGDVVKNNILLSIVAIWLRCFK